MPENQSTFQEEDFLNFINEEIALNLVPSILAVHEDHLLFVEKQPLTDEDGDYRIPSRAIGNKLNELQFEDSNGNRYEMTRISVGDIPDYQGIYTQNHAYTFYVEYNRIKLLPGVPTSSTGSLVFYYFIRPNELVSEDRVGIITNINRNTGQISVSNIPDHFSTSIKYDMYMSKSPHRHLAVEKDATAVNSTTNTITFALDDIPDELEVGDHIAQECECIIPQVPADLHPLITQYVAERILESIGDTQGLQNAKVKTREMEYKAGNIIDNRVDEAPRKLVNRNGLLRFGLHSKRYRRRN